MKSSTNKKMAFKEKESYKQINRKRLPETSGLAGDPANPAFNRA